MTSFLGINMQNQVKFDSLYHEEWDDSYHNQLQSDRTQWVTNKIKEQKLKTCYEN